MKERCSCNIGDRTSNLLPSMNHIDSKCINCISSDIISINPRDEDFSLMIVNKQASNHDYTFKRKIKLIKHTTNVIYTL